MMTGDLARSAAVSSETSWDLACVLKAELVAFADELNMDKEE